MGLYGAVNNAASGLRANAYAIENVSGNLANSQTTGYKRKDTHFVDQWEDARSNRQQPGGVLAFSRSTNNVQGDIVAATVKTHIAVNGDGYFIVDSPVSRSENTATFTGTDRFTRRGDFELDRDGYLVNGAGYFLKGLEINPATDTVVGTATEVIQINNDFLEPLATTAVDYRLNLPTTPSTTSSAQSTGSHLITVASYNSDPTNAGGGIVEGGDSADFVEQSISGGAVTTYNASGARVNLQLRWAKVEDADAAAGTGDNWNLFYQVDGEATGTDPAWQNVGTDFTFGDDGQLDPPVESITIADFASDGTTVGDLELRIGAGGITQFADTDGKAQVNLIRQNGYPSGELLEVSISDDGNVRIDYSNGEYRDIAQISLAAFNGDNFLLSHDGGVFSQTQESGSPILGALGSVSAQALETSNVDIADEFTVLTTVQQAYTANARTITTANEMIQETLNILR